MSENTAEFELESYLCDESFEDIKQKDYQHLLAVGAGVQLMM